MKKVCISIATLLVLFSPTASFAQTIGTSDTALQSQISAIVAQIQDLQNQLNLLVANNSNLNVEDDNVMTPEMVYSAELIEAVNAVIQEMARLQVF